MVAYRVAGDENGLGIGGGELLKEGTRVEGVFAHKTLEMAEKVVDYLDDYAFEMDGGGSWGRIMEIKVDSWKPGGSPGNVSRTDLDEGQIIVSGVVTRIYKRD